MPLIFEIEQKPTYKSKTVYGVEIPLYGELTVDEAIAVDRALVTDIDSKLAGSNTEYAIVRVTAWLSIRLKTPYADLKAQLLKSKPLSDALWLVYYAEESANTLGYEIDEPVTEGNDEPTEPLQISSESGTTSTSSLLTLDSETNSSETLEVPVFL